MSENTLIDASHREYTGSVARLLTIGEANIFKRIAWPDYPATYDLGNEHIPSLIRMACDMALHLDDSDGPEIWAPVHAWRALAQLRAVEAMEPLLQFSKIDMEDGAVSQEFAEVFGVIGPAAIAPIATFLDDLSLDWMPASIASGGLKEIATRHPECRYECVRVLTRLLDRATDRDPTAIGFTICCLLDLAAVEAIDAIREAFRLDAVDISIPGDLEDVEIDLGLRERRTIPKPHYTFASGKFTSEAWPARSDSREPREAVYEHRPARAGRNEPCPCGSGKKYKKCCLE
jgi:hypothetical protein